MSADWKSVLGRLVAGDIVHARCPGASYICLVEAMVVDRIISRRITTQEQVEFELATGRTLPASDLTRCQIDSITPLPVDIHNVLLGLERRMRLVSGDKGRLSQAEKDALKFVADFYPRNPIEAE